ncbi:DUF11 domain-containing protein [Candidatus Saccharibacteria bacterium]|nr:DUF11 domain-containing protein [Candidatus Saccharibacteria bacterium]
MKKTIFAIAATAVIAGVSMVPANVLAWGDSNNGRTTYTLEQINAGDLGTGITLNSITNGKIGDERNFVGAKLSSSSTTVWNANEIAVKDGETYTIRLYVHNNSPLGTNGVATGVKALFSLPTTVAKSHTIVGYLDSSNANPGRIWDEVKLTSSDDFYIEYVKGSAKYTNTQGTFALSDDVIISGAKVGFTSMNGEIPGCYEYDGQATIQVKVHSSVNTLLSKTVRIKGSGEKFAEKVDAKVGDEVEFQIEYENLAADKVENVMIRDILPDNMEYVAGSTVLYNSNYQDGVKVTDDTVTTSGINIGSYNARGNAYVRFTAKVTNKNLVCGYNQLVNWANATVNSAVAGKDDASVMVNQTENCLPKQKKMPNTGAGEIAGVALGAGSLVTAGGYFIASRKKLA